MMTKNVLADYWFGKAILALTESPPSWFRHKPEIYLERVLDALKADDKLHSATIPDAQDSLQDVREA